MFIARVDSEHFSFMAAGSTEEQALNALRSGWKQWATNTGATWTEDEFMEQAHVDEITPGMCIVDGDLVIYSEPHPAASDPYVHDGSIFPAECEECGGMGHTIGFEGPKKIKYPCESCDGGQS